MMLSCQRALLKVYHRHLVRHHPENMKMIYLLRDTLYFLKSPCIPLIKGGIPPFLKGG